MRRESDDERLHNARCGPVSCPAVDALYEAQTRAFADLTAAPIHAALPRARLTAERRALIGRALVGASIQVAVAWVMRGYKQSRREVVRTCVLVAMGTLRALADEAASR